MKNFILAIMSILSLSGIYCSNSKHKDSVGAAKAKNENQPAVNKEVATFLVKIADARMMGIKEGELAIKKSATPAIVDYGKLMIKDQEFLLDKVKKLAAGRNISLPKEISNDKKDGFEDLNAKTGEAFDNKFVKMMRIDHKRDIKDFTKAKELNDKEIIAFANQYLSMIESHLYKLEQIGY